VFHMLELKLEESRAFLCVEEMLVRESYFSFMFL
jgi:hypothetical protein